MSRKMSRKQYTAAIRRLEKLECRLEKDLDRAEDRVARLSTRWEKVGSKIFRLQTLRERAK